MKKILILLVVLFTILISSCIKKELQELTDVETFIKVDWDNMKDDNVEDILFIKINEKIFSVIEDQQLSSIYLKPGEYDIYTYNTPVGITINGESISVNSNDNGNIVPFSSIFYSSYRNIKIDNESTKEIILTPIRNSKEITINLSYTFEYPVESIKGTLNNTASSFNIITMAEDEPENIVFDFTDNKSIINAFGFIGTNYLLSLDINLTGDSTVLKYSKDISEILNNFNESETLTEDIQIFVEEHELEF